MYYLHNVIRRYVNCPDVVVKGITRSVTDDKKRAVKTQKDYKGRILRTDATNCDSK